MFSHIMLGSNDLAAAKTFYDATMAALGFSGEAAEGTAPTGHKRIFYRHRGVALGLCEPINGEPASIGNGSTIGISCDSAEQVEAWHAAGLANGGTAIESPPGPRAMGTSTLFLAYLRDPDGNKLCAMYRET